MKNFEEWNTIKQKIDKATHIPPRINEGEVWWVSIGLNVGSEIYGKNKDFARPVVILKKLNKKMYLVAPDRKSVV